jgi:hypothetical protein
MGSICTSVDFVHFPIPQPSLQMHLMHDKLMLNAYFMLSFKCCCVHHDTTSGKTELCNIQYEGFNFVWGKGDEVTMLN